MSNFHEKREYSSTYLVVLLYFPQSRTEVVPTHFFPRYYKDSKKRDNNN